MTKKILDVGNCGFDHGNLQTFLARHFDVELTQAHSASEANRLVEMSRFELVLVNRKFDRDGDDGIELIRQLKGNAKLGATPVMLLSNYPEYQQQAVAAGAEPGFGKAELGSPTAIEALRLVLEKES